MDDYARTTRRIKENKVRCDVCGDEIESKDRHDFVWCQCGTVAVDGGKDYLKRSFKSYDKPEYTELSTYYE